MALGFISREEGIRTPDTLLYTRFPGVRLKPLGHFSVYFKKTIRIKHPLNLLIPKEKLIAKQFILLF